MATNHGAGDRAPAAAHGCSSPAATARQRRRASSQGADDERAAARCRSGPWPAAPSAQPTQPASCQRRPRAAARSTRAAKPSTAVVMQPATSMSWFAYWPPTKNIGLVASTRAPAARRATPCASGAGAGTAPRPAARRRAPARHAPRTGSRRTAAIAAASSQYSSGGLWKKGSPLSGGTSSRPQQHLARDARVAAFVGHQQRAHAERRRSQQREQRQQRAQANRRRAGVSRRPARCRTSRRLCRGFDRLSPNGARQRSASIHLRARHLHHLRPLLRLGGDVARRTRPACRRPGSRLAPAAAPCSAGLPSAFARLLLHAVDDVGRRAGRARAGRTTSSPRSPARPASAIVGSSGTAALRCALVTAKAFSLPALICGSAEGRLSNIRSIVPPIRSSSAGPEPRYGKCSM